MRIQTCSISTGAGTVLDELRPRPGSSLAVPGGAKPTAEITVNHSDMEQYRKRLVGVLGGSSRTPALPQALMRLRAQGRFPMEKLMRTYPYADTNQATDDSDSGAVVKPILCMAA